jgi:hypothetical protein
LAEKRYLALAGGAVIWAISIALIAAPTLGLTLPVYPDPYNNQKLALMLASGVFTACLSAYLGLKKLK